LTLPDLCAACGPLSVCAPDAARETCRFCSGPQNENIGAAIAPSAGNIGWPCRNGTVMMPRHSKGLGTALDRGDDLVRDALIDACALVGHGGNSATGGRRPLLQPSSRHGSRPRPLPLGEGRPRCRVVFDPAPKPTRSVE